jgi:hypothetical protein
MELLKQAELFDLLTSLQELFFEPEDGGSTFL